MKENKMRKVSIEEIVLTIPPEYQKTAKVILENMKSLKRIGAYSEYAPHLDFSSPKVREHIGQALYGIENYCLDKELCVLLNFLVVQKNTELLGEGIQKWYVSTFDTLLGYDVFCKKHGELAEHMLLNNIIVLE
jgi:hypothetical protein